MNKRILIFAAIFAVAAIVLGAFGAHKLKELLTPEQLTSFETGVRYQMYHALLLLFLGQFSGINDAAKKKIFYVITLGIFCFSGSIYLLATRSILGVELSFLGPITPIGGLLFIAGWILLLRSFMNISKA
ncbi:MAG: DUF423 domain-containing protein [Flavobacteriaceae bacterium]